MKPKFKVTVKIVYGAKSTEVVVAERFFRFRWPAYLFAATHGGKTAHLHRYLKPWVYQFTTVEKIV